MKKVLVITAALATMLLLAACGTSATEDSPLGSISDLQDLEQLRTMFSQDDGEIRLVLLLSPVNWLP